MTNDTIDPRTGEVTSVADTFGFVPLDLAAMDEDELLAMFPTPVQLSGALFVARAKNSQAPAAIARYREKLRTAERSLKVAEGMAVLELRKEYGRAVSLTELRNIALATNERAIEAQDAVDGAWLELEYARDFERALRVDIDILRSLNANFRNETRP